MGRGGDEVVTTRMGNEALTLFVVDVLSSCVCLDSIVYSFEYFDLKK